MVWSSNARFTFMIAGTQVGKTILGALWLYREILRCGAGDYLAVTSSYDLFRVKMLPAMLEFFCTVLGVGRYWSGINAIELRHPIFGFVANTQNDPMYGRIILRSAASKAGLESATAKAAWLDECGQAEFSYDAWEAVQRRVSLNQGRVLGTTTPYNLGWLKREVYDRWAAGDHDYNVVQFPSTYNPAFPKAEYERAKRTLPEWRFEMFYNGRFVRPAGMVYSIFNEASMTYEPSKRAPMYDRWAVGIDFGGANTAKLYAWLDVEKGVWHVFKETMGGGQSSAEHAAQVLAACKDALYVVYIGGAFGDTQFRMDWRQAGCNIQRPYTDDVEVGISAVIEALKSGVLIISKELRGLISEILTYSRVLDNTGEPTNAIENKSSFHRLDALRYFVVTCIKGMAETKVVPNPFYK